MEVIRVNQTDGYASINLVFEGSLYEKKVSIDGHKFIIYAADGQYVDPQEVDVIRGAVGERCELAIRRHWLIFRPSIR
jgi:FtsP/CotA-like multicopper oxidase with cupredoxin domain